MLLGIMDYIGIIAVFVVLGVILFALYYFSPSPYQNKKDEVSRERSEQGQDFENQIRRGFRN